MAVQSDKPVRVCVLTGDPRLPDETKRGGRYNEEDFATQREMMAALEQLPGYRFEFADDHASLFERFAHDRPDLVLNFCDTGFRNVARQELHIPAFLEMHDLPYSGAPPGCMAICYDKAIVRLVARAHGVPVPREVYFGPDDPLDDLPAMYPALIKPNRGDGSVGITEDAVVRSPAEARAYLAWLRNDLPGTAALMQEYLPGPEYGVGLIGNPGSGTGLRALPVMEVDFSGLPEGCTPILCYESKALPDTPYYTKIGYRRTQAGEDVTGPMVEGSKLLFERLRCRDYARFDFRAARDGTPRLMEVNPNPAWASDGKLAMMAGFAGIAYRDLLRMILDAALCRVGAPA